MKFAVAAGVLVPTIPFGFSSSAASRTKNKEHIPLFTGETSPKDGSIDQLHSLLHASNTNNRNSQQKKKPVNKSSQDGQHCHRSPLRPHREQENEDSSDGGSLLSSSCPIGYDCQPDDYSPLGGICRRKKNIGSLRTTTTTTSTLNGILLRNEKSLREDESNLRILNRECDPTIPPSLNDGKEDADVGVLGICLHDEECVIDLKSNMGGTCVPAGTDTDTTTMSLPADHQRRREEENVAEEFRCFICPRGDYIPEKNYNLVLDESSGYGNMTCADVIAAAYFDYTNYVSINGTTCPLITEAARSSDCCAPELENVKSCDFCGEGLYIAPGNFDVVLDIPLDGYSGTTCEHLTTNANQTVYAFCPIIAQIAQTGGCCAVSIPPPDACKLCDDGTSLLENTIINLESTNMTCGEVQADESLCEEFSTTMAESCCQLLDPPTQPPTPSIESQQAVPTAVPRGGTSSTTTTLQLWPTSVLATLVATIWFTGWSTGVLVAP